MIKLKDILEASVTGNIKGVKGYTGFIIPLQWKAKKKSLEQSIAKTTGYSMVGGKELVKPSDDTYRGWKRPAMLKLKPLLTERIDYQDTASQIVKSYGVRSKIKFKSGSDKADYDWIKDIINLRPSYSNKKDFIMTVLHEIKHALDTKKMGKSKYEKEYTIAGEIAQQKGGDFHDDNPYEKDADDWAKKQYPKWKNKF